MVKNRSIRAVSKALILSSHSFVSKYVIGYQHVVGVNDQFQMDSFDLPNDRSGDMFLLCYHFDTETQFDLFSLCCSSTRCLTIVCKYLTGKQSKVISL